MIVLSFAVALDVLWESKYVYMAAFVPQQNTNGQQPQFVYITCPKGQTVSHVNFDDVCFGGGTDRSHKYFLTMLPEW